MKISTRGRYALRFMLDLAEHNTNIPVRMKDIANRQHISEKYLEQIAGILNKAGFVKSIRGAQGGYLLKKAPKEYTIGSILRLTEGSIAPVSCVEEDNNFCERKQMCVSVLLWEKINNAVSEVVDNTTLQDLIDWQKNLCNKEIEMK
ncbi:MAG: Rrf2 family transcriptional regulator [Lachnospiraceae bacterium]|nr:Rrf2 family transcriptional regulator [Lachnospiraceae bacterium]